MSVLRPEDPRQEPEQAPPASDDGGDCSESAAESIFAALDPAEPPADAHARGSWFHTGDHDPTRDRDGDHDPSDADWAPFVPPPADGPPPGSEPDAGDPGDPDHPGDPDGDDAEVTQVVPGSPGQVTGFPAPPPRPPRPPAQPPAVPPVGAGAGPGRLPAPPPPQHAQPPGRIPAQSSGPRPPRPALPRNGLAAPPPRHGPQPASSAVRAHYGYPLSNGEPVPYGRVPADGPRTAGNPQRYTHAGPVLHAQHRGQQEWTAAQECSAAAQQQTALFTSPPPRRSAPPAGFGARAVSFLVDTVAPWLLLVALIVIGATAGSLLVSLAVFAVGYLGLFAFTMWNSCYRQGVTGQSLGRALAGTRLVKEETGEPAGFAVALLRQVCHLVEFGIGLLWPLWDPRRQTFADKLVGTLVVRTDGADAGRGEHEPVLSEP